MTRNQVILRELTIPFPFKWEMGISFFGYRWHLNLILGVIHVFFSVLMLISC